MNDLDIEILGLLQEECAEVIQIASKIRRFGLESRNPEKPEEGNNQELLEFEVGDVFLMVKLLQSSEVIRKDKVTEREVYKRRKLEEYGILPSHPLITITEDDAFFKDTDISIYRVAALEGTLEEVQSDYPSLTIPEIIIARAWAEKYKKLGEPYPNKSMKRMLMDIASAGVFDDHIWDQMDRDRRLDNISCDIKAEVFNPTVDDPTDRRKYLLRQAAAIYAELETLVDDDEGDHVKSWEESPYQQSIVVENRLGYREVIAGVNETEKKK